MLSFTQTHFKFHWSAISVLAVAGLFYVCCLTVAEAQPSKDSDRRYEVIDREEGERRVETFRRQRLEGDYCFHFQLEHLPHRSSKSIRYNGTMWGTWNAQGALTRFQIQKAALGGGEDSAEDYLEVIVQNGTNPSIWKRDSIEADFIQLEGESIFEPLIPGIVYTPFDLQMPFVYWSDFEYEGPGRAGNRIVQRFLMLSPEESAYAEHGIKAVRISLDDTYDALFAVDVIGTDDRVRSEFSVDRFVKVQEQYIVKSIRLKDKLSKHATRFLVKQASVNLEHDAKLFDVSDPLDPSELPAIEFKRL